MGTQAQTASITTIDPRTTVGDVSLTVADLDRSIDFYAAAFGLTPNGRDGKSSWLGTPGVSLLHLVEERHARPWPGHFTGLFHFAVLVPTRADLGRWLRHWLETGHPLPGQGDHLVSEALYLSDPDGNGIEIYRDRPRSEWAWDSGRVRMATDPVDLEGVIASGDASGQAWHGLPDDTRIGHIHLQVGDIARAAGFYHDVLGFDIVASMPSALFVSAGGYHHHIGLNTWQSRGAAAAPDGYAGLRHFTIQLADHEARAAVVDRIRSAGCDTADEAGDVVVEDPWKNVIRLRVGTDRV